MATTVRKERGPAERIPTYNWQLDSFVRNVKERFSYYNEIRFEISKLGIVLNEIPQIWDHMNKWSPLGLITLNPQQEEAIRIKEHQLQEKQETYERSLDNTSEEIRYLVGSIIGSYNEIMNDFNKKYILEPEVVLYLTNIKDAADSEPEGTVFFDREMLKPMFDSFTKYLSPKTVAA